MFRATRTRPFRANTHVNDRPVKRQHSRRSRRFALESLEPREMLSATPEFQVLNDATSNVDYRYSETGASQGSFALASANATPRGAASTLGVEQTWVVDANRNVYVYDTDGGLKGAWLAGSLPSKASPEGIATNGSDIWIVDSKSDKVYFYAGAASRLAGSQNATSSFSLSSSNTTPKGLVSDGASLWVVNNTAKTDKVFKYTVNGSYVGSWTIDSANRTPTGITLDPVHIGDMWIVDSGTDRVYKYAAATSLNFGSQSAASSFALASGNSNPQGLVVPGRAWAETPYEVEWVRQFGTGAEDEGRGVAVDEFGSVFVSGATFGSISVANPTGVATPYLARFDAAGNTAWLRQTSPVPGVNKGGVRVATDSLGNVFQVVGSEGGFAASLNNFDNVGTLRWTFNLPTEEFIFNVATDDFGYAYMTSYEGNNIHLRKFDGAVGSVVWDQSLDTGGYVNVSGVSADHLGNIYIAAYTAGAVLGPNAGGYDSLVAKFTDAGHLLWTRQFGTTGADYAFQIVADQLGNVYTSGQTYGSLGGPNAGERDHFLAKHDSAGNLLWIRQFGTSGDETSSGSWVDAQGNIYRSMATMGALGGAHHGDFDMTVAKYDPAGNLLWATQLGTSGSDITYGGITGDAQGNLYVAGKTTGSLGGVNAGSIDAVLIKLSPPDASGIVSTPVRVKHVASLEATSNSLASNNNATNPSTPVLMSQPYVSVGISVNRTTISPTVSAGQADTNDALRNNQAASIPPSAKSLAASNVDQVLESWRTLSKRAELFARRHDSTLVANEYATLDAALGSLLLSNNFAPGTATA